MKKNVDLSYISSRAFLCFFSLIIESLDSLKRVVLMRMRMGLTIGVHSLLLICH